RDLMRSRNVYRGKILSLTTSRSWSDDVNIGFHRVPPVRRESIILADGLLQRIERQTVTFSKHGGDLRASRRHLRHGILLYGPPGTGKTLTAMYLIGQMPERTTILLTGRSLNYIERSCRLARLLEPSIVILEDVDLVAEHREQLGRASAMPVL